MPILAIAFPILPGKTPEWRAWMSELNGARRAEFEQSRRQAGVHERTFLQSTPMGDLVIVTVEGDDPGRAFGELMTGTDAFSVWFAEQARLVHGDFPAPTPEILPTLVVDSEPVAVPA